MDTVSNHNSAEFLEQSIAAAAGALPVMDKIIVAIHGIGSQLRSETIRSVARQFGGRCEPPLPVMPLGFFNLGNNAEVRVSRLDTKPGDPLERIGFAEIFWADIPEQVVRANDTLEETKAWGRTVVDRAEAAYLKNVKNRKLVRRDFQLGADVVEEIVETISVLESLLTVAARAGVFKFELAPLLRDFVGDVQLVTDFPFYRQKILYRFHSALAQIFKTFVQLHPGHTPEIYIVAHSEGTVISFLGLLEALSGCVVTDPDNITTGAVDGSWIEHVHGYMTIGSPIDKHLVLWPKLWDGMNLESRLDVSGDVVFPKEDGTTRLKLQRQIRWRNYYDYGDPIGAKLETAVDFLRSKKCSAFEFTTKNHDFGFSRYWLPGKAHNDYWQDAQVFGHFIEDVVLATGKAKPPSSSMLVDKVSMMIPYVFTFLLHLMAVFVLYEPLTATPIPPAESSLMQLKQQNQQQLKIEQQQLKIEQPQKSATPRNRRPLKIWWLGSLLLSITVAARLPYLVKTYGIRWHISALLVFLLGTVPCALLLPTDVAEFLGGPLSGLVSRFISFAPEHLGRIALIVAAFGIASSGWLAPRRAKLGRRLLIGCGSTVIAFIVMTHLMGDVAQLPIFPIVVGGLAFLYLWWLGILLFDLTFIWHRYIRRAVAVDTLRQWRREKDAQPHSLAGLGRSTQAK